MPPRGLWKGSISFGLVNIPIALYPATQERELSFRLLDRRDLKPVRYKRVNQETGEEVPWDAVVKGYEYARGDFVVLTEADFKRANVEATQTIEIFAFVDPGGIPPEYLDTPYHTAPRARGPRPTSCSGRR